MSEDKRFTTWGDRIKRDGNLLNIEFNTKTDAKLCCKLLNQMDKDSQEYVDKLNDIYKWHKEHYGKSILAERLEFKSDCEKENEQLKQENERYKLLNVIRNEQINNRILTIREFIDNCSNEDVKNALQDLFYSEVNEYDLAKENRILCSENERMTNKLNELALEFLNHEMVSMGKATEISEMCYHDFLKYRKEKGNPMELQL